MLDPTRDAIHTHLAALDWSYWDHGGDPGSYLGGAQFYASTWSNGAGPLGYGEGWPLHSGSVRPQCGNKYITTYFRREFVVERPAAYTGDGRRGRSMTTACVLYFNGSEVVRLELATHDQRSRSPGNHEGDTYQSYDWTAQATLLRAV